MAGHHDPRVLYSIPQVCASHIQNGEKSSLTPSGPQTLSLLMVPTSSPFTDLSTSVPQNEAPEEDFYLHLHLPPELDLPCPATTQVYHQPPRAYLIPRWDLGPDSGAFTRIEFTEHTSQEDIDTFETILAQCTSFLERARAPGSSASAPGDSKRDGAFEPYNPADWAPGGKYADGQTKQAPSGQIVLVDEDDGSIVGELGEAQVVEDPKLDHGSKKPVELHLSSDGKKVTVTPVSDDYLQMSRNPVYKSSRLVQNSAAASRLIVTSSSFVGNVLTSGADRFTERTKPAAKPMTFSPAAHERVRKLHKFTEGTREMTNKTVGQAGKFAQTMGATVMRHKKPQPSGTRDGKAENPTLLNKSLIAFSTITDGILQSGRDLLNTSSSAATTVVSHRYGPEAGSVAAKIAGGMTNVALVYIDVTGVTRRAILKSVAKGVVVGHVKGRGDVVVGGGDGGSIEEEDLRRAAAAAAQAGQTPGEKGDVGVKNENLHTGEPDVVGFGRASVPGPGGAEGERTQAPLGENLSAGREKPPKY